MPELTVICLLEMEWANWDIASFVTSWLNCNQFIYGYNSLSKAKKAIETQLAIRNLQWSIFLYFIIIFNNILGAILVTFIINLWILL